MLRSHRCAFVIADTAGKFNHAEEVIADFVCVRLHGSRAPYASNYTERELRAWAAHVRTWLRGAPVARDVYVYFDNDAKVHAPHNAVRLMELVDQ